MHGQQNIKIILLCHIIKYDTEMFGKIMVLRPIYIIDIILFIFIRIEFIIH